MKNKRCVKNVVFFIILTFNMIGMAADEIMNFLPNINTEKNINEQLIINVETDTLEEDPFMRLEVKVPEYEIDVKSLWDKSNENEPLVKRFAIGILRSKFIKDINKIRWRRCGKIIPDEDLIQNALYWSSHFLAALDEVENQTGVDINPWGAFATMMNESGADECALDFASRRWASTRKISKKVVNKFKLSHTRDEVWSIIKDPRYKGASVKLPNGKVVKLGKKSDIGPWQIRTNIRKITREKFDRVLSVVPGIYDGAYEMARRALWYSTKYGVVDPHPRPWVLWPGLDVYNKKNMLYDKQITMIARWLGATRSEMTNEVAIITGSKKNRKYIMNRWVKIKN